MAYGQNASSCDPLTVFNPLQQRAYWNAANISRLNHEDKLPLIIVRVFVLIHAWSSRADLDANHHITK